MAAAVAARTLFEWAQIVVSGVPTGYGEGAVAHAGQILARGGDPYGPESPGSFVSANYPPLAYAVGAAGAWLGPFTGLRIVNVVACCAVALLAGWRARSSPAVAVAIGASFLALYPVAAWGSGARVDQIAVACTAFAVVIASADPRRAALAGVFGALAMAAKPTAVVPLLAVLAYFAWRERAVAVRFGAALTIASIAVLAVVLARFDPAGLWRHLVTYNAFPYDVRNPVFLVLLGILLMGALVGIALYVGDGRMRAYLVGALGVVALGGHEGATFNYLLDLAAASCVALAPLAARPPGRAPALIAAQLVATLILTTMGPLAPPSLATLSARVEAARDLPQGAVYAEDSGVLIAANREPVIDDTYVWARLVALGVRQDDVTPRIRDGAFAAVVSDVDLERLEEAPVFEQQRWPPQLTAAVLERYRLDRHDRTLWIYLPR
ncbi:MAG: hypothetical protein ACRDGE_01100 [Candidatus Limnocylindria bacterium]